MRLFASKRGLAILIICFTCLVFGGRLFTLLSSQGFSLDIFDDPDEPFYLRFTLFYTRTCMSLDCPIIKEYASPCAASINIFMPNNYLDWFLGTTARHFGISLPLFSFLLDIFSFIGSGYLIVLAIEYWGISRLPAFAVASMFLLMPWISSPYMFLNIPPSFSEHLLNYPMQGFASLPVMRAVHTQISVVFFSLWFYFLSALNKNQGNFKHWLATGLSTSLLLYCYPFAWFCSCALTILYVIGLIILKEQSIKTVSRGMIYWGASNLLGSAYGLWIWHNNLNSDSLALPSNIGHYYYFSFETLIYITVFTSLLFVCKAKQTKLLLWISISCLFSELILMNIGSVMHTVVTGYHFSLLYLYPLLTLVLGILFFKLLKDRTIITVCSIALTAVPIFTFHAGQNARPSKYPPELFQAIARYVSDYDSLLVPPLTSDEEHNFETCDSVIVNNNHFLLYLKALAFRNPVSSDWNLLPQKLSLQELLFGTPKCLEPSPSLPGDIIAGIVTFCQFKYIPIIERTKELRSLLNDKQAKELFTFKYLLESPELAALTYPWNRAKSGILWQSQDGHYKLWGLDNSLLASERR